jgi:chemotaxis signal transduction protein
MSDRPLSLESQLAELRHEFDRSFAFAPSVQESSESRLLLLGMGEDRIAVRLAEVARLLRCPSLVSLPGHPPELLGIAGIRGALVAVFSLAILTGRSRDPEPPRWLLLCGPGPLGFAFTRFEGQLVAPSDALRPFPPDRARSPHVDHLVTLAETPIPVLSVSSVLRFLAERSKELPP